MKKHIVYNIKWNTDKELFDFLPKEIEIPEDVWEEYELDEDEDVISDYIIDLTGFPLYSYDIKEENIMNTMKSASIYDTFEIGNIFHNCNGTDYVIVAFDKDADVTLFQNPNNKFTPYVGATHVMRNSWSSEKYFKNINDACNWFNKATGAEDEDTRADVCITTEYDNGSGMYYSYKKSALEKIEEIIDEILEKDPQAEINISVDVE